jgi:hypothetical protein
MPETAALAAALPARADAWPMFVPREGWSESPEREPM